jgi:hypothetical protein
VTPFEKTDLALSGAIWVMAALTLATFAVLFLSLLS